MPEPLPEGFLNKVIHLVVAPDQTCGVPHRFIGENVALLRDVVHYANEADLPLAILSLDQEKSFDRVDWPFLRCTLSRLGFGPSLIKWVDLLYSDIRSSILINGYTSRHVKPSRGLRQGCPLSPFLYVLTMEVLAVNIWVQPSIKGIFLPRVPVPLPVLSLYADDTSVISSSDAATVAGFDTYALFETGTGAKLNMDKCKGIGSVPGVAVLMRQFQLNGLLQNLKSWVYSLRTTMWTLLTGVLVLRPYRTASPRGARGPCHIAVRRSLLMPSPCLGSGMLPPRYICRPGSLVN